MEEIDKLRMFESAVGALSERLGWVLEKMDDSVELAILKGMHADLERLISG